MSVRTLGDAWRYGWKARAVCQFMSYGKRSERRSIVCRASYELDLQTLVWTRGERFPREDLESRLRCPRCGQMRVQVVWSVPKMSKPRAAATE
jgi:hypothetical protein